LRIGLLDYSSTSHTARSVGHYVGSTFRFSPSQGSRFPYPCVVCVPACQHQRLFLLRLRIVRLHLSVPVACPVPIAVPSLSAVAHGRPVQQATKNANVLASTHDSLPKFLRVKLFLEHPENLETIAPGPIPKL